MAANSWMQNPVGYVINPDTGRAQLTDIGAVLTNPVFLRSYLHVLLAALVTAAVVMLAVSAWHLRRRPHDPGFQRSARLALVVLAPATVLNLLVGRELGVTEGEFQPMKIAAAEVAAVLGRGVGGRPREGPGRRRCRAAGWSTSTRCRVRTARVDLTHPAGSAPA